MSQKVKGGAAMFKNLPKSRILKQITRLNNISGSPQTAYKFDPKYTKLEVYLIKNSVLGSAIGLRKFWRQRLPTFKFHNENVDFVFKRIVTQTKEDLAKCPTKIVIHDSMGNKNEIDCSNETVDGIFEKVVKATEASPVPSDQIDFVPVPPQYQH